MAQQPAAEPVAEPAPVVEPAQAPQPAPAPVAQPQEDLSGLSISELADRLESGLNRLKEIERATEVAAAAIAVASETPAAPVVPAAPQAAGGVSVSNSEEPMQVPPLKPVEPSAEEVQAARQADMDAALKAALGTLEKMTAQR